VVSEGGNFVNNNSPVYVYSDKTVKFIITDICHGEYYAGQRYLCDVKVETGKPIEEATVAIKKN